MSTAIAIFVKTPSLSPLKTRLATTIGQGKANEFYRLSLNAIRTTLNAMDIIPYWAIAEDNGLDDPMWKSYPRMHTGDGNLGVRQHHIYQSLLQKHDRVLLIGSDAPQLSSKIIKQAIDGLKTHDFVIGPANDGGYYLFGGRATTQRSVWENTPWSAENTYQIFTQNLPDEPYLLESLTDIDQEDDLAQLKHEMPSPMNNAQIKLLEWIETL